MKTTTLNLWLPMEGEPRNGAPIVIRYPGTGIQAYRIQRWNGTDWVDETGTPHPDPNAEPMGWRALEPARAVEIPEQAREYLQRMAMAAESIAPDATGFLIFCTDGEIVRYVSNIERRDAINLVKTWLFSQGDPEAWMKHIV